MIMKLRILCQMYSMSFSVTGNFPVKFYCMYWIVFNRKSEIGTLHKEFDLGYDSVIRSIVESEMKNSAAGISIDHFRFQRSSLERSFLDQLKKRLEGRITSKCFIDCCFTWYMYLKDFATQFINLVHVYDVRCMHIYSTRYI